MNVGINILSFPVSDSFDIKVRSIDMANKATQKGPEQETDQPDIAYKLTISPQARALSASNATESRLALNDGSRSSDIQKPISTAKAEEIKSCQTCGSRKYKDGSNDASVSFQAPTQISRLNAPTAVIAHENEHNRHEQTQARKDGDIIVKQRTSLHTSICPECMRIYISGGSSDTLKVSSGEDRDGANGDQPVALSNSGYKSVSSNLLSMPSMNRLLRMNHGFNLFRQFMKGSAFKEFSSDAKARESYGFLSRAFIGV